VQVRGAAILAGEYLFRIYAMNVMQSINDGVFNTGPLFPKAVGDANANAMDKALEALNSWLAKANEAQAARCDR